MAANHNSAENKRTKPVSNLAMQRAEHQINAENSERDFVTDVIVHLAEF